MPTIYRATCECGFTDSSHEADPALELADGTLEILPHPCERSSLKAHGYTWDSARRAGKLFILHHCVCEDCGRRFDIKREVSGIVGPGCWLSTSTTCLMPAAVLSAAYFVPPAFGFSSKWLFVGSALLALFGIHALASARADKDLAFENEACPACKSKSIIGQRAACRKALPCPKCGKRALRYELWGIS